MKIVVYILLLLELLYAQHPVNNPLQWIEKEYKDFRTYPRIDKAYKLLQKGEDTQAKKLLEKALEIDPQNKKAMNPLISICLKHNNKTCINKYIGNLKNTQLAYYYLYNAQDKIDNSDYPQAKKYALKALDQELLPHDRYYAKLIIIESNIKLKKYDEASIYIDKLYYNKSMPHFKDYHEHLVNLSIEIGRVDLGKAQIKKYLDAGNIPTDEELLRWSKISDNLGDTPYAFYLANMLSTKPSHLKWQVDLLIKQKKYIQASQKMEILFSKVKSSKNQKKLLYLYTLTSQQAKIIQFYEKILQQRCDEFALSYLLDTYKNQKSKRYQLLQNNYPYTCVKDPKKLELMFAYIEALHKTDIKKGQKVLSALEQKYQSDPTAYLNLSNIFSLYKDCKNTILYAQKYLDIYPNNLQALKNTGYCYDYLNKKGMAVYYLSQAQELQPEDLELSKSLGTLYSEIDRPKKALHIWQTYLEHTPDNNISLSSALLFYQLKNYDKSINSLSLYEKNHGEKNGDYYLLKAKLSKRDHDCNATLRYYVLADKAKPSAFLKYDYALELNECNKTKDAIVVMQNLSQKDSQNKNYKMQISMMANAIEDYNLSISNLEDLSQMEPNNADLHTSLAYLYLKNSDKNSAISSFKKAIDTSQNESKEKLYLLKSEVKYLSKQLDVYFAQTIRLDNYTTDTNNSYDGSYQIPGASYDGSGGLTVGYRPIFAKNYISFFGEVVYGQGSSFRDAAQLSIGVKYQPFQAYGWVNSIQKIFDTSDVIDKSDIFLRSSASFFDGYAYKFNYNTFYNNLYLDAGYYLQKKEVILFANYEFGKIYKIKNKIAFLPYITSGGTFSNTDQISKSRLDVGVGISLLNWFYETRYEPDMFTTRLKLEGRIKYAGNAQDSKTIRVQFEFIY